MRVTALLFDMGGTLFDYSAREQMGKANVAALRRLGLDPNSDEVRAARREASERIEREYATRRSFIHRDLFRDRIALTARLLGVEPADEILDRFDEEQRLAVIEHLSPMPDVWDTLRGLRARGLYLGVVSNADDDYLAPVLERHGVAELVDDITSSEEAGSCKPDPVIYEYALGKARRTAAETLFVGDSPQHDVAGAQRAGMRAALIGNPDAIAPLGHGLEGARAEYEIRALTELLDIVDRINGAS